MLERWIERNYEKVLGRNLKNVQNKRDFQTKLRQILESEKQRMINTNQPVTKTRGLERYRVMKGYENRNSSLKDTMDTIQEQYEIKKAEEKAQTIATKKYLDITLNKEIKNAYRTELKKKGPEKAKKYQKDRLEAKRTYGATLNSLTNRQLKALNFTKEMINIIKKKEGLK